MKRRISASMRKTQIFESAMVAARKIGIFSFTMEDVAVLADCKSPTVKHYFGGISKLRLIIINHGFKNNIGWIKAISLIEYCNIAKK